MMLLMHVGGCVILAGALTTCLLLLLLHAW
jgi:hypothetical protein